MYYGDSIGKDVDETDIARKIKLTILFDIVDLNIYHYSHVILVHIVRIKAAIELGAFYSPDLTYWNGVFNTKPPLT